MRLFARASAIVLAGLFVGVRAYAQAGPAQAPPRPAAPAAEFLPVPENVKAEGLPPIRASIAPALAPYAGFRRALLTTWHPTRREMLIQTTFGNVAQLHSVAGPGMDRQQVTFFPEGLSPSSNAAYEPGGSYFILSKDAVRGAESAQLLRYDVTTRQTTLLTDGRSRNGFPAWSSRSGLIAFDSTRRNGRDRDLYVMNPMDPASARLVAQVEGTWSVAQWSPDDRELLVVNAPAGAFKTFLWRVDAKTGVKTALTPLDEETLWRTPQYSADGRFVYALSNRDSESSRLWRCELATGAWKLMSGEEDMLENYALSPDGRTVALVLYAVTGSRVELRDARTLAAKVTPKLPNGQLIGRPIWRPDSSEVAFTFWTPRIFGDVFSVNTASGAVERWTKSESGVFNPEALPEPEIVKWKSFDGLEISGVLYRPAGKFTGPRPVVISIHGGPSGTAALERPRYQGRSQYFLNELGIAIIYPNVRGSYGFGKAFARMDDQLKREDSVKDIGALLDWIATQPTLDKNRVMVTGISYGGYMTYAAAAMYSDRLRCALSANGISDFLTYFEFTDETRVQDRRAEYGDEREPAMREFLKQISPVTQAAKVRIPLLIINGARDTRVPPQQGDEMTRAVAANGVPVWHLVFADEGHVFPATVANNNYYFYVWIQFVQQYLLN